MRFPPAIAAAVVGSATWSLLLGPSLVVAQSSYSLVKSYEGSTFFDDWEYYGYYDNLTNGDVNYVNRSTDLTYLNDAGNAVVRVSTAEVPYNEKRDTVRITTQDTYGLGSLWVMDAVHVPFGCSVWPAFWSQAPNWPAGGEIDTFEGVNLQSTNQMAMHTTSGCTASGEQTGELTYANCDASVNFNSGCTVVERNEASYGSAFAAAGGGVWATELSPEGVSIWFWSRPDVPSELSASSTSAINTSSWGTPSAFYSTSTCAIDTYFQPQHLILTITLCGDWAGTPAVFNQTCEGVCYLDYVLNGTNYNDAYFEIPYIKVYQDAAVVSQYANSSTSSSSSPLPSSGSPSATAASDSAAASGSAAPASSASALRMSGGKGAVAMLALAAGALWTLA